MKIDPLKSVPIKIDFIQSGLISIHLIKIDDEAMKPTVRFKIQQMPLETIFMSPLPPLPGVFFKPS